MQFSTQNNQIEFVTIQIEESNEMYIAHITSFSLTHCLSIGLFNLWSYRMVFYLAFGQLVSYLETYAILRLPDNADPIYFCIFQEDYVCVCSTNLLVPLVVRIRAPRLQHSIMSF